MLTGNKYNDRKILNKLEDKDLVNVCQTNKKIFQLCDDQIFWMNRVKSNKNKINLELNKR